jgi:SAM-dependent methyltransferase
MMDKIRRKFDALNRILSDFEYRQTKTQERLNDIYSFQMLQRLVNTGCQLPVSDSSLKMHSVALLINDIIVHRRQRIVEFGAGISTILLSRLIRINHLAAHVYSVDESQEWIAVLKTILEKEDLLGHVTFIHAPLEPSGKALKNNRWYSEKALDEGLAHGSKFDLVLVDGPSAWREEIALARYPALPYMHDKLAANYSFYLDDADREGEKSIVKSWQEAFKVQFEPINSSLALAKRGTWYNTRI